MRVEMEMSADAAEPYVVIHAPEITEEIQKLSAYIQNLEKVIAVYDEDNIMILKPDEIYMVVSAGRGTTVFGKDKQYASKRCLYEYEDMLRNKFMRISKTTLINLTQVDHVEPSFSGMLVVLKNGKKDYISRKYLPGFKKYLGI